MKWRDTIRRALGGGPYTAEVNPVTEHIIIETRETTGSLGFSPDEKSTPYTAIRYVTPSGRLLVGEPETHTIAVRTLELLDHEWSGLESEVEASLGVATRRFNDPPDPLASRVTPGTDGWGTLAEFTGQGEPIGPESERLAERLSP